MNIMKLLLGWLVAWLFPAMAGKGAIDASSPGCARKRAERLFPAGPGVLWDTLEAEFAAVRAEARAQALEEAARLCDASDKMMRPIGCETAGELAADIRALPGAKVTP